MNKNPGPKEFQNSIIISGGYDIERIEADIGSGLGDLVAFGWRFINNPDLVGRFKNNQALSTNLKMDLFYSTLEKDILIIRFRITDHH